MERPQFIDQLQAGWNQGKFVSVGLDADTSKLPDHLKIRNGQSRYASQREFMMRIVDSTKDMVLAYKPNLAFFEDDPEGEAALEDTVKYIHAMTDVPVIADAKRGDILNTNSGYARTLWGRYGFDATTVHSYLGADTYPPFLNYKDQAGNEPYPGKGIIAMVKTSNPFSPSVQDLVVNFGESVATGAMTTEERAGLNSRLDAIDTLDPDQAPLYVVMAYRHGRLWEQNPNIGIVVGATHAESFRPVRRVFDGPILIPGIGTQGGDLAATLRYAPDSRNQGMIINSSSGIIFASNGRDFAEAARAKTHELHNQITQLRKAA